ncbi:MAG: tyrosine-type recombinase/integrase [Gammaproteobacteria bacterium]|nr:tyrosine-type recombinase/integrase [Gammaproteobacteria bacterium]
MSQWKAAREAAGLWHPGDKDRHVKFHTTRHTAASHMVQNGIDLYTVQKVLGHKTPHVTQRYSHLRVEHQIEAVDGRPERNPTTAPPAATLYE